MQIQGDSHEGLGKLTDEGAVDEVDFQLIVTLFRAVNLLISRINRPHVNICTSRVKGETDAESCHSANVMYVHVDD